MHSIVPKPRAVSVAAGVRGPTQGDMERRQDQKFSEEGSVREGGSEAAAGQENGIKRGRFFCFCFLMLREIGACLPVDGEDGLIRRKEHPGSYVPERVGGAGCHSQVRGRHG